MVKGSRRFWLANPLALPLGDVGKLRRILANLRPSRFLSPLCLSPRAPASLLLISSRTRSQHPPASRPDGKLLPDPTGRSGVQGH